MKASVTYPTYVHDLVEGVSKNVHHLRESLNERGVEATDESPRVDVGAMNSKRVYVQQGIAAYRRVLAALRDPSIDVVHYHVSIPVMSAWAALARARAPRADKPLILHVWNAWYDARDVHVRAPGAALYHKVFNGPATTLPFLSAFDQVVVSSEYQRLQLERHPRALPRDVRVIPNGVDLEGYQPAPRPTTRENARRELGLPPGRKLLLYYGHLTPWKGVRVLVESLPRALDQNPDTDLVIARTRYGHEEHAIRDRLRKLGLASRVHFLGVCDVPLLLQAVDAGVVPSTAAVGTACHPNVVLEYHAAGIPIVGSRVGSIPEVVADGVSGLLARPGDALDLGNKLQDLLHEDEKRRRMGAAARARAEERFDWRIVAKEYEAAFEDALADGSRRRHARRDTPGERRRVALSARANGRASSVPR